MVGADVEVLDAEMSIVASKVVVDEQGKYIYYFYFWRENFDCTTSLSKMILLSSFYNHRHLLFQLWRCYWTSSTHHPTLE